MILEAHEKFETFFGKFRTLVETTTGIILKKFGTVRFSINPGSFSFSLV